MTDLIRRHELNISVQMKWLSDISEEVGYSFSHNDEIIGISYSVGENKTVVARVRKYHGHVGENNLTEFYQRKYNNANEARSDVRNLLTGVMA